MNTEALSEDQPQPENSPILTVLPPAETPEEIIEQPPPAIVKPLERKQARRLALCTVGKIFTLVLISRQTNPSIVKFKEDAESCREKVWRWYRSLALVCTLLGILTACGFVEIYFSTTLSPFIHATLTAVVVIALSGLVFSWRSARRAPGTTTRFVAKKWKKCRRKALKLGVIDHLAKKLMVDPPLADADVPSLILRQYLVTLTKDSSEEEKNLKMEGNFSMLKACQQRIFLLTKLKKELGLDMLVTPTLHIKTS